MSNELKKLKNEITLICFDCGKLVEIVGNIGKINILISHKCEKNITIKTEYYQKPCTTLNPCNKCPGCAN